MVYFFPLIRNRDPKQSLKDGVICGHGWAKELSSNSRPSCWPISLTDSFSVSPRSYTHIIMNELVYKRGTGDVFSVWILCCLAVAMDQRDHGPKVKWYYFPLTNNEEIPCKITHTALVLMKFTVWFLPKIQVYKYICWKNVSDYLWVAYVVSCSVSKAPFLAWYIVRYMYYLLFLLYLPEE